MLIDPFGLDSIDAVALTEAAEAAVQDITDEYGSTSAQCNRGVAKAFEDLTESDELNGKTANQMYDHMNSSDDFEEIGEDDDMQDESNDGKIIIGVKKESGSGHIVMGVPGEKEYSTTWQEDVPQVMDTGYEKRHSKTKISNSWGSASKDGITYFRYTGHTYTSRTYSGGALNTATVKAVGGLKKLQPLPAKVR